jgi:hypothetical protein
MVTANVNIPIPQSTLQNATVPNITVNVNTVSAPVIEREPIFTLVYRGIDDKQLIPLATLVAICVLSSLLAHSFGIPRFLRQNSDQIFNEVMDRQHNYSPDNYSPGSTNTMRSCNNNHCKVIQSYKNTSQTSADVRKLYRQCVPHNIWYEIEIFVRCMKSFATLFGSSIFSSTTYADILTLWTTGHTPESSINSNKDSKKMSKMHLLLFGLVVELVGVGLPFMLCGVPFAILLWKQYRYIRDIEILKAIATRQTILNAIDALEQHELYTVRMNNIYRFLIITGVIHFISRILFISYVHTEAENTNVSIASNVILYTFPFLYFLILMTNISWICWPYASNSSYYGNFNIADCMHIADSMHIDLIYVIFITIALFLWNLVRSIIGFMYQTPAKASAKFAVKREILAAISDDNLIEDKIIQTKEMITIFTTT